MKRLLFIGAICAACSGEFASEPIEQVELDPVWDDHTARPWNDLPYGEDIIDLEQVDKTRIIATHGWSVASILKQRCTDSNGMPVPCQWGYEPFDLTLNSFQESHQAIQGRCGNPDIVTTHPAVLACIVPSMGESFTSGQNWTYKIDFGQCPADSARRAAMQIGTRAAFNTITNNSQHTFTEVTTPSTSFHHITVRCSTATEAASAPAGSIATGLPTGFLQFSHSAPFSATELCEDPPNPGLSVRHVADRYFRYNSGTVFIHWERIWTYLAGDCRMWNTPGFFDRAFQSVVMHEMGHVFGFVHHRSPTNNSNVMFAVASCPRLDSPPAAGYLPFMRNALGTADIPNNNDGLHLVPVGLACYNPVK